MGMVNVCLIVVSAIMMCSFAIFSWHKFMEKSINFNSYKLYFSLLIGTIGCTIINFCLP